VGTPTSIERWQRVDRLERSVCVRINRLSRHGPSRQFFATVSRLGDGPIWYLLMFVLAVSGEQTAGIAAQMAVTGIAGTLLYRVLKSRLVRERPCVSHPGIVMGCAPLDRYSFPSGHTLHAVGFTTLAVAQVPELAVVLVPFALLVAASRVVLGLHYPTDVAAGALIGLLLATASLALGAA